MSGQHRVERLNELFRRELSRLILTEVKDPRVAGVSVTAVRTAGDLSFATVYVRADPPSQGALEGLERAAGFMRRALGRELHLRKIPEFRFVLDDTPEHASRIEALLRELREGDSPGGG